MPKLKTASKKTTTAERKAVADAAAEAADAVEKMTTAERAELILKADRMSPPLPDGSLDAAGSDLLKLLIVVGNEFIRRYFPDANHCSFHATRYALRGEPGYDGPPSYDLMIPLTPRPNQEAAS